MAAQPICTTLNTQNKMIFTEKYRPTKISEIVGQRDGLRQILNFLTNPQGAILVHGPVGCGKTSAVHAVANELGYEVLEVNAGDLRNKDNIKGIVGSAASQKSLFFKKKLILIDEVDNLTNQDYGGIGEITSLIGSNNNPIIMCANKPFEKKLMNLRKKAELVSFKKVSDQEILAILKRISEREGVTVSDNLLRQIALLSGGDIRAAVTDLQASGKEINGIAVSKREQEVNILSALRTIFKSKSFSVLGALENVDVDLGEAMFWIDENLPAEYRKKDLYEAYKALSKADVFMGRVRRQQHWRLMVYASAMMTAGVAFSKSKEASSFATYRKSGRLLKLWLANKAAKKTVAEKLGQHTHSSSRKVFGELAYLKIIFKNSMLKENLTKELNLNNDEVELLLGPNKARYA